MMLKYWLFHLLFQAVVNVALPLPIISSTTSSSISSILTPPANLSECLQSNYCNNGACVLIRDPIPRVSCTCNEPFVDTEEGLCTIKGKSRRDAFIIRCFAVPYNCITSMCSLNFSACFLECWVETGST